MINLKLTIVYNGTKYYGWQKQKLTPTVQQRVEEAFKKIFNLSKKTILTGSGRTDKGVHSIGQVANIKLPEDKFKQKNFLYKINSILPADIEISSFELAGNDFNARFNAKKREYRYYILTDRSRLPFYGHLVYYYPHAIDYRLLKRCIKYFRGTHDFSTFSNSPQENNPVRKVFSFTCKKKKDLMVFRITANSFLQGMVRNIMGTILDINRNRQNPAIIPELFRLKNNRYCGNKAPSCALFLYKVYY